MKGSRSRQENREKPRIGISSCLLGEKVRYDGGHKRSAFLVEDLAPFVRWVPVCPEVEIGLTVPRPPIGLYLTKNDRIRLLVHTTGEDLSPAMESFARRKIIDLGRLDGYVFKSRSPSCGLKNIPVRKPDGTESPVGRGFFARMLCDVHPSLPVIEEIALEDPSLRRIFLEKIFPLLPDTLPI